MGSKTMPGAYCTQKSRNHSITDFPIFEDLCGWKKNWKVTWKNGQFCPKHQFWYFPSKTKYESPFSQFFGFFTCLVRFQQYLKTGNIEGNFVFGLFKSRGYEQSLKERWKLAQTQILIFSLKNNIWKHIFSIFHIFTYSGCFSKHTLYVHWNHCFFESTQIFKNGKIHNAVISRFFCEISLWHRFWPRIWTPRVEITLYGDFELFI